MINPSNFRSYGTSGVDKVVEMTAHSEKTALVATVGQAAVSVPQVAKKNWLNRVVDFLDRLSTALTSRSEMIEAAQRARNSHRIG